LVAEEQYSDGEKYDENQETRHAVSDRHDPSSDSAMIYEHGNQKRYYDSRDEYSHKILERESFKKLFQILFFPEISSQESDKSDNDDFLPHPEHFPENSVQTEFVGE